MRRTDPLGEEGGGRGVGGARGVSDVCLVWVYDEVGVGGGRVGKSGFASATQQKFNEKAGSTVNSDLFYQKMQQL
jgi:hypothetical protein